MNSLSKGEIGERLVSNFFDESFSNIFSFPNPKTKNNAEVADVLIWLNRTVFLVEVKTRNDSISTASIESWCHSKIEQANIQIRKNAERIYSNEEIFLNNEFYHSKLDCKSVCEVVGLIVLVYEEESKNVIPSKYLQNIYSDLTPIHVIAWKDLERLVEEIKTVPDLKYYLQDRFEYIKQYDISLEQELDALGYYKLKNNNFPIEQTDFLSNSYYSEYKKIMREEIQVRNVHNQHTVWIEKIESLFTSQRKQMANIPLGLLFAWELGVLSERERAYYGEKINKVQQWFIKGNSERYFSYRSQNTGNWLFFYFTQLDDKKALTRLEELTKLKVIKEIELNNFKYGVYSIGFRVSTIYPYPLMNSVGGMVMAIDAVEGKYTSKDIESAYITHGKNKLSPFKIEEFPASSE
jgi:hypothetical protein